MTKNRQKLEGNQALEERMSMGDPLSDSFCPEALFSPQEAEPLNLRQKTSYWLEVSKDRVQDWKSSAI